MTQAVARYAEAEDGLWTAAAELSDGRLVTAYGVNLEDARGRLRSALGEALEDDEEVNLVDVVVNDDE